MISIDVTLSGPQIAGHLVQDEEEMAHFLCVLLGYVDSDLAEKIAHHLSETGCEKVAAMLRLMADAFDPAKREVV